jgi:hypothetical protein
MKALANIGTIALVLAGAIGSSPLPVLAKASNLPKVGVVKNKAMGAGCSYWLPKDRSAAPIFLHVGGESIWMNLDGRDTELKSVGKKLAQKNAPESYATKNFQIKLVPRFIKRLDYSEFRDAQITISNGARSTTIKATGVCGC